MAGSRSDANYAVTNVQAIDCMLRMSPIGRLLHLPFVAFFNIHFSIITLNNPLPLIISDCRCVQGARRVGRGIRADRGLRGGHGDRIYTEQHINEFRLHLLCQPENRVPFIAKCPLQLRAPGKPPSSCFLSKLTTEAPSSETDAPMAPSSPKRQPPWLKNHTSNSAALWVYLPL